MHAGPLTAFRSDDRRVSDRLCPLLPPDQEGVRPAGWGASMGKLWPEAQIQAEANSPSNEL